VDDHSTDSTAEIAKKEKPVWSSLQKISQRVGRENLGHAGREPTGQPEMFFSSWTQILF